MANFCRVYWGSHGCELPPMHEGPHICSCAPREIREGKREMLNMDEIADGQVGAPPYYGPDTEFYGEDTNG